jgi:hypothetical protein
MEEEAEPSDNAVRASASHDSLLAADSDMFEYSQVCVLLPLYTRISADLCCTSVLPSLREQRSL